MKNICFVCMGNTCRSPMAECIFRHILKQNNNQNYKVTSYGLNVNIGENINDKTKKVLKNYKIKYSSHKAKKLTDKLLKKQDFVFTMTDEIKHILRNYSNAFSIKEFIDGVDISDPYGLGEMEYETVFKLLFTSCNKIYEKLEKI